MFDKELFYSLFGKYDVELSDKYSKPMMRYNDKIIELDKIVTIKPLNILSNVLENMLNGTSTEDALVKTFTDWIKQDIENNKHFSEDKLLEFLRNKYGDYCDINLKEKL